MWHGALVQVKFDVEEHIMQNFPLISEGCGCVWVWEPQNLKFGICIYPASFAVTQWCSWFSVYTLCQYRAYFITTKISAQSTNKESKYQVPQEAEIMITYCWLIQENTAHSSSFVPSFWHSLSKSRPSRSLTWRVATSYSSSVSGANAFSRTSDALARKRSDSVRGSMRWGSLAQRDKTESCTRRRSRFFTPSSLSGCVVMLNTTKFCLSVVQMLLSTRLFASRSRTLRIWYPIFIGFHVSPKYAHSQVN